MNESYTRSHHHRELQALLGVDHLAVSEEMSESTTLWLFGTIIGVLTTVIGGMAVWIIAHSRDCRDFRVKTAESLASILAKLDRVKEDIGDHDTGMRGDIHKLRSEVMPFVLMTSMQLEQKQK